MNNEVIWFIVGVAIFSFAAWRSHLQEKKHGRRDDDNDMGDL